MQNGNGTIRKIGTFVSIAVICAGAVAGYCDTKSKTYQNEKEITKLDKKVEKGFDKLEKKMECFNGDLTALKVQNAEILGLVRLLKERTE